MSNIKQYNLQNIVEGLQETITRKVTREDIEKFCELTGDFHPLHTNEEYAQMHGFQTVLLHGLLVSSFTSALVGMKLPGENAIVVSQQFEYLSPVYPDDELTIIGKVAKIRRAFSVIEVEIIVRNQKDEIVSQGGYRVKLRDK